VPEPDDESAPVFSSWKRLYTAVVAYLFLLILLFYWFTVTFNHPR
jgi:hypothetical protein